MFRKSNFYHMHVFDTYKIHFKILLIQNGFFIQNSDILLQQITYFL